MTAMASSEPSDRAGDEEGRPCPPCRGTGRVISTLGGSPQQVTCPWCEGTGRWLAGHDAQERLAAAGRA